MHDTWAHAALRRHDIKHADPEFINRAIRALVHYTNKVRHYFELCGSVHVIRVD